VESRFVIRAAAVVVCSRSYSIGARMPRLEWRRRRLWKTSMYSRSAFASSTRAFQRRCCATRPASDRGLEQWGEIFGDAMGRHALIDRLVHHATMITLKGKSYRLHERGRGAAPATQGRSLRSST
jgi:hypothetical protein